MATYISTTTGDDHIAEMWALEAYGHWKARVLMPKLVKTQFAGIASGRGFDKVNVPKRGTLTVSTKSAQTDISLSNPTDSVVTITVDQHKYVGFGVEDITATQASQDIMAGYIRDAAAKLAEQVDTDLLTLANNFTNAVGDFTSAITEAEFLQARRILQTKKVPVTEPINFVFTPHVEEDLLQIANFAHADKRGEAVARDVLTEAKVGRWFGVDLYSTTLVEVDGAGTDQENNLMFTRDAIGLVVQQLPLPTEHGVRAAVVTDPDSGLSMRLMISYDHSALAHKCTLDVLYGYAELNDDFGVWVKTQKA